MRYNWQPFLERFHHISPVVLQAARVAILSASVATAVFLIFEIWNWRMNPVGKLFLTLLVIASCFGIGYLVIMLAPLMLAKLALIAGLVIGTILCWVLLFNMNRIHRALDTLKAECELATNLSYLQGEMTRAQLQALNDKIQKAVQPEEIDATQTMLKSISPIVMLYFKKERDLVKWALAAANLGRSVFKVMSPPKSS